MTWAAPLVMAVVMEYTLSLPLGDQPRYRLTVTRYGTLTLDHSLVEQLVLAGQISGAEARTHKRRNIVYRTMGRKGNVEVDVRKVDLEVGDRLLLCSDGLNSMIEDTQIAAIVHAAPSPMDAARQLVDAANIAGGDDNITAVIVEVTALKRFRAVSHPRISQLIVWVSLLGWLTACQVAVTNTSQVATFTPRGCGRARRPPKPETSAPPLHPCLWTTAQRAGHLSF